MDFVRVDNAFSPTVPRPGAMLIGTKLLIPPSHGKVLPRPHLIDRLSAGKDRRLIVITGVAGSGKTSLACQWIRRDDIRTAWYSLDGTDNESDLFFRYLLASLADTTGDLACAIGPWLQEQRRFTPREVISFLVEILTPIGHDLYLVLDDYHLITSPEIHEALVSFLNYMPPRMHMVVISRSAVPIPLSRFRVRGQVVEISADDMMFTEKETERFFAEIMPVNLTPEEIHDLARYTEGWVGGLQLFGLSLKDRRSPEDLGDHLGRISKETTGYLIEEVVDTQPERIRTFLRATALLDRFNVDLCREITGFPDAADILEYVYRNNLFLIPLDGERTWYRYHHLLSEAIRKETGSSISAGACEVHRKAALWFATNGYLEDAFRHAFSSGDFDFAADLLEDYLPVLQECYEAASGLRWLARLPHNIFLQRTLLRLYECRLKIESLQLLDIEAVLQDIEEAGERAFARYEGSKKSLCRDLLAYLKYVLPYYYDPENTDVEKLSEIADGAFAENRTLAGFIKIVVAGHYLYRGDPCPASQALQDSAGVVFSSENLWTRMCWYKQAAHSEKLQGRLQRVDAISREAFAYLDRRGVPDIPLKFMVHLPLGWVSYFRNDLKTALQYALTGSRYMEETKSAIGLLEGYHLLALVYLAADELRSMDLYLGKMQETAKSAVSPNLQALADAVAARLSMSSGDMYRAEQWARKRRLTLDEPFSYRYVHECMAQADLLFHRQQHKELLEMLSRLRNLCASRNLMEVVLDIDLLESGAHLMSGNRDEAVKAIMRPIAFGEPNGYLRPFVNYRSVVTKILNTPNLVAPQCRVNESPYCRDILAACGTTGNEVLHPQKLAGKKDRDLTPREMEILTLIAAGYRNKEIAAKVYVTVDTVKAHLKHIFEKLSVETRVQAVRRARDLGFV